VVLDALRSSPHTAGGDHPEASQHSAYRDSPLRRFRSDASARRLRGIPSSHAADRVLADDRQAGPSAGAEEIDR
jgi:hypothetical protein